MEEAQIPTRRPNAASSLLPALNAGQIQSRTLLRNASSRREGVQAGQADAGATAATAASSGTVDSHHEAAAARRQAKAPSPKAFRAGFAYERTQTPEHKARQRQQQQQPAVANVQEGLNHHVQWSAAMPAAGSSNVHTRSSATGSTAAAAASPPAAAASAPNSRAASNTGFNSDGASSSKAAATQQHSRLGLSSSSSSGPVGLKSSVIGGSSLLAGHLKGQALHVLQSFVAESLAMLPPESVGDGGEGSASNRDSDSDCGSSSFGGSRSGLRPGGTQHPSSSSRAGSEAGCHRQRQRLQHCSSRMSSSRGGSSRGRAIAAAAVAAGAAAAAAVSAGKRRTGSAASAARHRAASLPDDQEEEEAALVAMLMMLPSIEPPAVQSAPEQFSLPVVAAALGQSLAELQHEQQRQQQELRQQRQQPQRGLSAALKATSSNSQQAPKQTAAAAMAASPVQQQQQQRPLSGCNASSSKAGARASSAHQRLGTAGLAAAAAAATATAAPANPPTGRLPLKTETEGLQLQLRVLAATPALAQQYTKAQVLLAQAFGADVQQQPAAAAATVAAAAAAASATAAARSRPATSGRSSGAKSARKSNAAAGTGTETKQQPDPSAAAADAAAAAGSGTARAAKAGRASNRSPAGSVGAATSTASASAAAAAGSGSAVMDPIAALLSGRLSPVRSRVLGASWDQQVRRQQQRLQHGGCSGTSTSSLSASCSSLPGMPLRDEGRPFCMTPEPFLRSSCGSLRPGAPDSRCCGAASPAVSDTRSAASRSPDAAGAASNSLALATLWAPGSSGSCEAFAASSQPRSANSRYSRSPIAAAASTGGNSSPGVLGDTSLAAATLSSHAARRRLFAATGGAACSSARDAETSAVFVTQTREEQQQQWGAIRICSTTVAVDPAADADTEGRAGALAAETCNSPGPEECSQFLFERHLQLEQGQWQQLTADAVEAEVALSAAAAADVGPCYAWGDTARLIRRFQQQPPDLYPYAFNLNNSFAGRQQMAALAQALPQIGPGLEALLLRNDGIDDFALQVLVNALLEPGCSDGIICLDLGYNRLSPDAARLLAPLLHRPPRVLGATAAAAASSLKRTASAGQGCVDGLPRSLGGFERSLLLQLVLAGNRIGDTGAEVVCKLVATGDSMLQLLDLSRCGITDRAAGCLRGLLEGARQLQVLRIGWNSLGPKGGRALAEGLAWSSTLQQLLLPWSGISDGGASHIAKALENNSSVKLLDMSGCQVSAATCVVLCETLSLNKELQLLVLQDNPLGAAGAHKLLKAVHAGNVKHVDLAGCGFLDATQIFQHASEHQQAAAAGASAAGAAGSANAKSSRAASAAAGSGKAAAGGRAAPGKPGRSAAAATRAAASPGAVGAAAAAFNAREPDGCYCLDLGSPSDRQVAVELLRLTAEHGLDSWNGPTLDKKPYSIAGVTKQQLPSAGTLCLTFDAKRKASWGAVALTDGEFQSMWSSLVDPRQLARTAAALERELTLTSQVLQADAGARAAPGEAGDEASGASSAPSPAAAAAAGRGLGGAGGGGGSALNTARTAGSAASVAVLATLGVGSWYGAADAAAGSGSASEAAGPGAGDKAGHGCHAHSVTDGWKLQLLRVLCRDCYFTSAQARGVVAAFSYGEDKVEAATQVFGRVVDPQNFSQVYTIMAPWQVELADSRIGCLKLFSPDNPTGKYSLLLSHPAQRLVAARLVELFCQQHIEGLCAFPHSVCFTSAALDEAGLPPEQLADPTTITLPKTGLFKVCFVDLRPVPAIAVPLSAEGFAVLIGVLVAASHLDARALSEAVDDVDVKTKVTVVGRFNTWQATHGPFTGKVSALRRLAPEPGAVRVKDLSRFVQVVRLFAIHHFLTGPQLVELVRLLPESASEERVELCSCFWARLVDRSKVWTDVVRCLRHEQQVSLCQRLGYANVYDPVRPALHYRLRMWRPDDHQIAWRLHRTALNAPHECFSNFAIDGVLKKISQTPNLWSVMRGSAADNEKPTVTLEFDFVWEDSLQPHWAAVTIQAAWRAFLSRQHNPDAAAAALLTARLRASRPGTAAARPATGVRALNSSRLGQRQPANLAAAGNGTAAVVLRVQTPDSSSSSSRASGWPGAARSPCAGSPTSRLAQPQWDSLLMSRAGGAAGTAAGSSGHQQQQQRLQSAGGNGAAQQRRPDSAASAGTFLSLGMSSVEQAS